MSSLALKRATILTGSKKHHNLQINISTLIPKFQNSTFFNKCYISMINSKKLPKQLQTNTKRKDKKSIQKIIDKEKKVNYNIIADNSSIFRGRIHISKIKKTANGAENPILTQLSTLKPNSTLTK